MWWVLILTIKMLNKQKKNQSAAEINDTNNRIVDMISGVIAYIAAIII